MKFFVTVSALVAAAMGAPSGPLTPLVGNLVATPRGPAPIDLEGFSEDLDQDGFVDPVVPAAPVVHAAPLVHAAPFGVPAFRAAPFGLPAIHSAPAAFHFGGPAVLRHF